MFSQKCCKKWLLPEHRDPRRVRNPGFSEQHEHVTESRSRSDSVFKGYFSDDVFAFLEVGFRRILEKSLLGLFWPATTEPTKAGFGKILDLAMLTFHVCHDLPPRKHHIWAQRLPGYFFCYRINKSDRLALWTSKNMILMLFWGYLFAFPLCLVIFPSEPGFSQNPPPSGFQKSGNAVREIAFGTRVKTRSRSRCRLGRFRKFWTFWSAGQEPRKSGFGKIPDLGKATFHVCHHLPPRKRHIWLQRLPVYFFLLSDSLIWAISASEWQKASKIM